MKTRSRTTRRVQLGHITWDHLEPRWVQTASPISIAGLDHLVAIEPAPNAVLTASPSRLALTFDRPLDPFLGTTDVLLDRIESDGSTTHLFDEFSSQSESLDETGTRLIVDIGAALPKGRYRISLSGLSFLMGQDGELLTPSDGVDVPLADFSVMPPPRRLTDAQDLGVVGSKPITVSGSLDFTADPFATKLYQVTVRKGHVWRLGAEVSAERDGSSLASVLSLFDAHGQLISTSTVGRSDAPNDPFLFAGVPAGTYYLGISGIGNAPGQPGGYNPATADRGAVAQTQPGGPFTLNIVADPVVSAPRLSRFRLDFADSRSNQPTGFSVQFSRALNLGQTGSSVFQSSTNGVRVVDQNGHEWPIAAVAYDEKTSRLSYLFRQQLPQGRYTLRLPDDGALTDLAGLRPVSAGLPSGVLATFRVLPNLGDRDPLDLGALVPNDVLDGAYSETIELQPGQERIVRAVVLYDDFYFLQYRFDGAGLIMQVRPSDGGAPTELKTRDPNQDYRELVHLQSGEYTLSLRATGDDPVRVQLRFVIPEFRWDSILANGIGQGPALALRFISPSATNAVNAPPSATVSIVSPPGVSTLPSPFTPPVSSGTGSSAATPPASSTDGSASVGRLSTNGSNPILSGPALSSLGGQLVGRPNPGALQISPVGPGVATALAAGGPAASLSALTGMGLESPQGANVPDPNQEEGQPNEPPIENEFENDGAILAESEQPLAEIDTRDVAIPGWLDALRQGFAYFTTTGARRTEGDEPPDARDQRRAGEDSNSSMLAESDRAEEGVVQEASLASPIELGLLALVAHQVRQAWKRRRLNSTHPRGPMALRHDQARSGRRPHTSTRRGPARG